MLDITAADGYDHLFPYVLIAMTGICLEVLLHGPLMCGPARAKSFNREFME
jgi:hypothetical protein